MRSEDETVLYRVVVNSEDQYSILPAHRLTPIGWTDTGDTGTRLQCLERIRELWKDMRPLSVRKYSSEQAR
jgi:MbtH protein